MADTDKLKKLIENGVHFGHQTQRRDPRMDPFIWGKKNGVHLIDVSKTVRQLERATQFLETIASEGKQILFVGTKRPAQAIIEEVSTKLNCPFSATRWVGGTLSNYPQVRKSVTKLLHFEDIVSKADKSNYTKKEIGVFQKVVARLQHSVGGVRQLHWPIGALVVVDAKKEATAIKEAVTMNVPVVALVDTNSDPSGISIIVPCNDDSARSIRVIIDELAQAIARGMEKAKEKKLATAEEAAQEGSGEAGLGDMFADAGADEEAEGAARRPVRPRRAPGKSDELREAGKTLDKASSVAQKASAAAADKAEERVAAPAPAPRSPSTGPRRPRIGGAPTGPRTPGSGPRTGSGTMGGPRTGSSTGPRRPFTPRPRTEGAERTGQRPPRATGTTEKPVEAPKTEKASE